MTARAPSSLASTKTGTPRDRLRTLAGLLAWGNLLLVFGYAIALLFGEKTRITLLLVYAPRWPLFITTACALALAAFARDRRGLVAQGITALVALGPIGGLSVSLGRSAHGTPLRLLTWNVFYGKLGPDTIADQVAAAGADIVVMQAVRTAVVDRVRARGFSVHADNEFALATHFPIVSGEVLPELASGRSSQSARYRVQTPQGLLDLIVVHPWSPRRALFDTETDAPTDFSLRDQQLARAVELMTTANVPALLVGDTNAPPGSAVARKHFGGLRDAWESAGLGFGWTFPSKRPWMRIDRVFGGKGVRFLAARVGPRSASDHRSLYVELELVP
jgi:vancomycin resistance protein VanJ